MRSQDTQIDQTWLVLKVKSSNDFSTDTQPNLRAGLWLPQNLQIVDMSDQTFRSSMRDEMKPKS